uniref:Uncharacterized protein n=1 Tax=Culex nigripalpus nucleopolyhedrovirus TaxID=130556 RepID=Q99GP4_NPVCN|nr:unknown [Culex nigripalpus nucleopolyhedrovirus]
MNRSSRAEGLRESGGVKGRPKSRATTTIKAGRPVRPARQRQVDEILNQDENDDVAPPVAEPQLNLDDNVWTGGATSGDQNVAPGSPTGPVAMSVISKRLVSEWHSDGEGEDEGGQDNDPEPESAAKVDDFLFPELEEDGPDSVGGIGNVSGSVFEVVGGGPEGDYAAGEEDEVSRNSLNFDMASEVQSTDAAKVMELFSALSEEQRNVILNNFGAAPSGSGTTPPTSAQPDMEVEDVETVEKPENLNDIITDQLRDFMAQELKKAAENYVPKWGSTVGESKSALAITVADRVSRSFMYEGRIVDYNQVVLHILDNYDQRLEELLSFRTKTYIIAEGVPHDSKVHDYVDLTQYRETVPYSIALNNLSRGVDQANTLQLAEGCLEQLNMAKIFKDFNENIVPNNLHKHKPTFFYAKIMKLFARLVDRVDNETMTAVEKRLFLMSQRLIHCIPLVIIGLTFASKYRTSKIDCEALALYAVNHALSEKVDKLFTFAEAQYGEPLLSRRILIEEQAYLSFGNHLEQRNRELNVILDTVLNAVRKTYRVSRV